jgi:hypothetical protein
LLTQTQTWKIDSDAPSYASNRRGAARGRYRRWLRMSGWVALSAFIYLLLELIGPGRGRGARAGGAAGRPDKVLSLSLRRARAGGGLVPANPSFKPPQQREAATGGSWALGGNAGGQPVVAPPSPAVGAAAPQSPAPSKPAAPAETPPVSPTMAPTRGAAAHALAVQTPPHARYEDVPLPVKGTDGPLAAPEEPLPDMCYNTLGRHKEEDTQCYLDVATSFRERSASDEHAPYCWGYSGRKPGEEPLLFHTMTLTPFSSQTPLMLWSFLATQCCDAVLWFWMAPAVAAAFNKDDPPVVLPPHLRHRVVYKTFDADAEWSRVATDFPRANATALARLMSFEDVRYVSDWGRQLVMYAYGGTWVDIDTVFLQDFRPVLRYTPFAYRAGFGITINNAVMRLGRRPNAVTKVRAQHWGAESATGGGAAKSGQASLPHPPSLTRCLPPPLAHWYRHPSLTDRPPQEIMAGAVERVDPKPDAIFYTLGWKRMGDPKHFHYLSELLFDFIWLRCVRQAARRRGGRGRDYHAERVRRRCCLRCAHSHINLPPSLLLQLPQRGHGAHAAGAPGDLGGGALERLLRLARRRHAAGHARQAVPARQHVLSLAQQVRARAHTHANTHMGNTRGGSRPAAPCATPACCRAHTPTALASSVPSARPSPAGTTRACPSTRGRACSRSATRISPTRRRSASSSQDSGDQRGAALTRKVTMRSTSKRVFSAQTSEVTSSRAQSLSVQPNQKRCVDHSPHAHRTGKAKWSARRRAVCLSRVLVNAPHTLWWPNVFSCQPGAP